MPPDTLSEPLHSECSFQQSDQTRLIEAGGNPFEFLWKFLVMALAIFCGAIVALIVGLYTGWIPFVC